MTARELRARFRPASGAEIPPLGLGTFGSDRVGHAEVAEAVHVAIGLGYRHIDCAAVYGNEARIGGVLASAFSGTAGYAAVARQDLWITSKLWNDMHAPERARISVRKTLVDLRLEYLDLYLVHWPFRNFHPPGCDVSSRSPDATPYVHERFMETWGELERMVDAGLVRHIGTSNMTIPKLALLLRDARIKPFVNEMELHPHFQQPELFAFVVGNGIIPVGYSPLGSPGRPTRDTTPEDTVDMEDPVIVQIAHRRGIHPAGVCLKWAVARGHIPIPFSVKRPNIESNFRAATGDPLDDGEMREIAKIDKRCRLIKGQVFLWPGAGGWEELWDPDGTIAR